jgi:DNA-binding GntR family transcriptional regulator
MGTVTKETGLDLLSPLIGRETLEDRAYEQLRHALMSGRFRPGESMTIRGVAAALGTSPMPIRGALQRLQAQGALMLRPNRTLEVPELSRAIFMEMRDLRILLEGLSAERAASIRTEDDCAIIGTACDAMAAAAADGNLDGYILANWAFHSSIYRSSRMPMLLSLIEGMWLRIGPYVPLMMPDREHLVASITNHRRAEQAVRLRDPVAAKAAIAADIADSAFNLLPHFGARTDGGASD